MADEVRVRRAKAQLARAEAARVSAPRRALGWARRARRTLGLRPGTAEARRVAATAERAAAHALRSLGRHAQADGAYRRAARVFRALGDPVEAARCDIGRVDALMYLGRYGTARQAAAAALRAFRRAGDARAVGRLLNNLGNLEYRLDRPAAALAFYGRARRALAGDPIARARVDANRANCLALRGEPAAARRLVRRARAGFARAGRTLDVAGCDYAAAYLLFLEHRYAEALFALAALETPFERAGAEDYRALLDLDAAEIYLRLGRPADAVTAAAAAAVRGRRLGLRTETAKARTFEALGRAARGEIDLARPALREAVASFRAEGNATWGAMATLAVAELDFLAGRRGRARAAAERAARAFRGAGELEREAGARLLVARAGLRPGRGLDRVGARALGRARACARRARSAFLDFRLACLEGDVAVAGGDRAAARRAFRRAQRLADSTAARLRGELYRATDWSAWEEAYPRLVALEVEAGRTASVFRELERARQRTFAAADRESAPTDVSLDRALERRLRDLACRLEARGRGRAPLGPAPGLSAAHAQDELRAVARELERIERGRIARAGVRRVASSLDLAAQRSRLASGTLALEWFETPTGAGVLALDREGARLLPDLVAPGALAAWSEEIRYHARGAAGGDGTSARGMEQALDALREDLLAVPLAWFRDRWGALPAEILLVPAGPLVAFPWPALSPAPISVVPSLDFARRTKGEPTGERALFVGLGDDLPGVRREIEVLAGLAPHARVLVGAEATAERLARELAAGVDWLHLAGHGRSDEHRAILSGLRLADRWIHLPDLAPRGRSPRVVVLAACRTGEIAGGFRSEWQGLPGGLLRAGTRTLLASLWDVEDEPALALCAEIHRRLVAGETLGVALRNAGGVLSEDPARRWNGWAWGLFGRADARFPATAAGAGEHRRAEVA